MGLGIALIRLASLACREIGRSSELNELREKIQTLPEHRVTCPYCHKTFTIRDKDGGLCTCQSCGWWIQLGPNGTVVAGYPFQVKCLRCLTDMEYNDAEREMDCPKCKTTQ